MNSSKTIVKKEFFNEKEKIWQTEQIPAFKPTSERKTETFVINTDEYDSLCQQLNSTNKTIFEIKPTFVAGKMSDRFVITAGKL